MSDTGQHQPHFRSDQARQCYDPQSCGSPVQAQHRCNLIRVPHHLSPPVHYGRRNAHLVMHSISPLLRRVAGFLVSPPEGFCGPSAFSVQLGCADGRQWSYERHAVPLGVLSVPCPSLCCRCSRSASWSIGSLLLLIASSWPSMAAARLAHVPFAGTRRAASTADMSAASVICRGRAVSASSICRSDASGARLPSARAAFLPSACRQQPCRGCDAPPVSPRHSAASPSAQEARPAPAWRRGWPCRSAATRCCA